LTESLECAEEILKYEQNHFILGQENNYKLTPVHVATREGYWKTLKEFLNPKYKFNLDFMDDEENTILHYAVTHTNLKSGKVVNCTALITSISYWR